MTGRFLQVVDEARMAEPSDDRLMAEAAAGRPSSFTQLVARHEARVRRFCLLLLKDPALADDVAQEVFLRLWEARARYRSEGRLRELLFTMARNGCRSAGRKAAIRSLFASLVGTPDPEPPRDELAEAEEHALLRSALEKLPEQFRVPLVLRFVEELPYEEIARVIGRTPSAARSRVHYGLKALGELLPPEVMP
jgi:RNA polymerase sigma-70 factor, ECF subfamily